MNDECEPYRNSDAFILARINLALLNTYALRPDSAEPKVEYVALTASKTQELPANATFMEFLGTAFKVDGKYVECEAGKPTEASDDFLAAYAARCPAKPVADVTTIASKCDAYVVKSFSFERKNGRTLTIDPAPPAGLEVFARIIFAKCPVCSPENIDEHINCKFYAAIYEKTMAYMYDAESEDASNTANSVRHHANFMALVAAQYQTDARIGSGYYLGQKPDGSPDPNVRRG
jgi:hypothetical protein